MFVETVVIIFLGVAICFGTVPLFYKFGSKEIPKISKSKYGGLTGGVFKLKSDCQWSVPEAHLTKFNPEKLINNKYCVDQSRPNSYYLVCFRPTSFQYWLTRDILVGPERYCSFPKGCHILSKLTSHDLVNNPRSSTIDYYIQAPNIDQMFVGLLNSTTVLQSRVPAKTSSAIWFKPLLIRLDGKLEFYFSKNDLKPNFTQMAQHLVAQFTEDGSMLGIFGTTNKFNFSNDQHSVIK